MKWRTIDTDTESRTGVAPVCDQQDDTSSEHGRFEGLKVWADEHGVYDCCPHPHIETYSEPGAANLAGLLTALDAGPCS
jgi:hypothetical protein